VKVNKGVNGKKKTRWKDRTKTRYVREKKTPPAESPLRKPTTDKKGKREETWFRKRSKEKAVTPDTLKSGENGKMKKKLSRRKGGGGDWKDEIQTLKKSKKMSVQKSGEEPTWLPKGGEGTKMLLTKKEKGFRNLGKIKKCS